MTISAAALMWTPVFLIQSGVGDALSVPCGLELTAATVS
jgi:hypothetical protein